MASEALLDSTAGVKATDDVRFLDIGPSGNVETGDVRSSGIELSGNVEGEVESDNRWTEVDSVSADRLSTVSADCDLSMSASTVSGAAAGAATASADCVLAGSRSDTDDSAVGAACGCRVNGSVNVGRLVSIAVSAAGVSTGVSTGVSAVANR